MGEFLMVLCPAHLFDMGVACIYCRRIELDRKVIAIEERTRSFSGGLATWGIERKGRCMAHLTDFRRLTVLG